MKMTISRAEKNWVLPIKCTCQLGKGRTVWKKTAAKPWHEMPWNPQWSWQVGACTKTLISWLHLPNASSPKLKRALGQEKDFLLQWQNMTSLPCVRRTVTGQWSGFDTSFHHSSFLVWHIRVGHSFHIWLWCRAGRLRYRFWTLGLWFRFGTIFGATAIIAAAMLLCSHAEMLQPYDEDHTRVSGPYIWNRMLFMTGSLGCLFHGFLKCRQGQLTKWWWNNRNIRKWWCTWRVGLVTFW